MLAFRMPALHIRNPCPSYHSQCRLHICISSPVKPLHGPASCPKHCSLALQVWDLTAGKLLHDFRHEDAITGVEYHPSEFILATSSADRTVKWWDLETSEMIDTAGPDMTGTTLTTTLCN